MSNWLDDLWKVINARGKQPRRWVHRQIHCSTQVVAWLDSPARTDEDRAAFAELLLQLDADPIYRSVAVLKPGTPPGVRTAEFGVYRVIFVLDLASGDLRIVSCHG